MEQKAIDEVLARQSVKEWKAAVKDGADEFYALLKREGLMANLLSVSETKKWLTANGVNYNILNQVTQYRTYRKLKPVKKPSVG